MRILKVQFSRLLGIPWSSSKQLIRGSAQQVASYEGASSFRETGNALDVKVSRRTVLRIEIRNDFGDCDSAFVLTAPQRFTKPRQQSTASAECDDIGRHGRESLDDPLPWRDKNTRVNRHVRRLAEQFGYD
jgi:hypothetical protein